MAKTIVILGASFAGLHIAHYLLQHNKDVKVVVVTKVSREEREREPRHRSGSAY